MYSFLFLFPFVLFFVETFCLFSLMVPRVLVSFLKVLRQLGVSVNFINFSIRTHLLIVNCVTDRIMF